MSLRDRDLMRPILRRILPRIGRWYLRKERKNTYQGIKVTVPPGVFHPGLFFSTRIMLKHLERYELMSKSLLEIGAGSGMVSIWSAKQGADVTATDISKIALKAIEQNAADNQAQLTIVDSDLFQNLPPFRYDYIVMNPPYYKGIPKNEEEYAWYAGPNYEYFSRLFSGLKAYRHPESMVLMVLSEDCDLQGIRDIATREHWSMEVIHTDRSWGEWLYIYQLRYLRVE